MPYNKPRFAISLPIDNQLLMHLPGYKHDTILLNSNVVTIASIVSGGFLPQTEFELNTVSFIKDWLNNVNTFTISTSGSTGIPKQITINRNQMTASARMTIQALGVQQDQTALICLNTQFIAGKMMLVRALEHNLKIVALEPSSDPFQSVTTKVDFLAVVPLQLHNIIESASSLTKLNSAKNILVGGGTVSKTLDDLIQKHVTTKVYQTYGMTETISHIALQLVNTPKRNSSFNLLPGITITQDDRGCLVADVPYLDGNIVTNDLIELLGTTSFQWLGRYDNIINSGGVKIVPEVLEKEIGLTLKGIGIDANFFVFGEPDEILGNKLILAFEGLLTFSNDEILRILKQTLAKYQTPKEIRTTAHFVYTETGKIIRKDTQKLL